MKKVILIFLISILIINLNITAISINQKTDQNKDNDFYFIHITDTHILHKIFDRNEDRVEKLQTLIDHINSFDKKPAFVVITGDLVEWGSGIIGRLNYKTLINCFNENSGQYYLDTDLSIPIYFTPGNHDYYFNWNLINYHRFIDNDHIIENDRYTLTFEEQNLTLFFMDSGCHYILKPFDILGGGLTRFDITWLEESLDECKSKYKIILMHYPAVNWGQYDVIARNRETFIELCEAYNVELVLTGHTHVARVFDKDKNFYHNDILPLNCSQYSTLYVQTDACKEGSYYRNISIINNDIWLKSCKNN